MADSQIARNPNRRKSWRYLSFASDRTGDFLGALILEAVSQSAALDIACETGLYPGGLVLAADLSATAVPAEIFRNRLLTRDEVRIAFPNGTYSTRQKRADYAVN